MPAKALTRLVTIKAQYGGDVAREKRDLVRQLGRRRLVGASQVERLHETLCFLHAYPDDLALFREVARALGRFRSRGDVRQHREQLVDTGIAGTEMYYRFHASTALWLAERWPEQLSLDWDELDAAELDRRLHLLVLYSESPGLDEPPLPFRAWLDRLRGQETDATFLIRRLLAQPLPWLLRNRCYDSLRLMIHLSPGPETPSRTGPRFSGSPFVPQPVPLRRQRPDLSAKILRGTKRIRAASRQEAEELIDLARESMVTRSRDLYTFEAADPRDVRIVDCGHGLELACIGVLPEVRFLLEAVYGWLLLRNGVPLGYALSSALWQSAEIAFNVFATFRGAEAAWIYANLLASVRQLFDVDTFTIYPYQLGHGNEEALESGAWWFYYKLGFRPRDPAVTDLARAETQRMARRPSHRSSLRTLRRLAERNLFLELGSRRQDVIGVVATDRVGTAVSDALTRRFGSDRERAELACADEVADLLWAGSWRRLPEAERLAWRRWAPMVAILPGVARWSPDERRALVDVIRAKGARRESDFVERFDRHSRLRAAVRALARNGRRMEE